MFSIKNEIYFFPLNINMQTSLVKWLCIKNTIPPCMQQPFANIVAFFKRSVALAGRQSFPAIQPLRFLMQWVLQLQVRTLLCMYWMISEIIAFLQENVVIMLFCKIQSILELLQHGFEKSAILPTHWLKHTFYLWTCRFLLAKCATLL